jgi:radical SAM protein with 4Fe4S-binding SPASM domain
MPVAASIEPNNTCNLHCPECPAGTNELAREQGFMNPSLFQSVVDQLSPNLAYLTLYFQGEPYMSKHLFDYISYARSRKIFVATSTNGHFFNEKTVSQTIESGLNKLIISVDGFNQQSYGAYRKGGDFNKLLEGIRMLTKEKKKLKSNHPQIVLQCLMLKTNENQLKEIKSLGKELGVDQVTFKTAQFNDFQHGNPLMPKNPKFSRYKSSDAQSPQSSQSSQSFSLKNKLQNSCFRMWSSVVVTWNGKVVPCCFDKDATHSLGNLKNQNFREIWRGKPADDFRKKILRNRKGVGICTNCSQTY